MLYLHDDDEAYGHGDVYCDAYADGSSVRWNFPWPEPEQARELFHIRQNLWLQYKIKVPWSGDKTQDWLEIMYQLNYGDWLLRVKACFTKNEEIYNYSFKFKTVQYGFEVFTKLYLT